MSQERYVVETRDLTKAFGTFLAVDKLNLQIKQGEIFGFLGPNGAGKSTVIRLLCGLLEPTCGGGTVLGYDLQSETEKIKRQIGYMSQKFSLYDDLTVEENLRFYAGVYSLPAQKKSVRIAELVEMAGLQGREKNLAGTLSGGWKQRLALGCAIIAEPSLVFLDEPTSGVSPTSRRDFFNLIRKMAEQGTTVLVTTHFMDEAERCHRIAFLSGGRLIALDTPHNLRQQTVKGCLVELALPSALGSLKMIAALPYVRECNLHGRLLHVLLKDETDLANLREATGAELIRITPSLEDVFITLAKKQRKSEESSERRSETG